MFIEFSDFKLSLNYSEAVDIQRSLISAISHDIETHWRRHMGEWPECEAPRLGMIKTLCRVTGHNYEWEMKRFGDLLTNEKPD